MEGLLDLLGDALRVEADESSATTPHPRFAYYKCKPSASCQDERRRAFIEAQKQKRYDFIQHARCLAEGRWDEANEDEEDMDITVTIKKPERSYRNQLMLSEWLVDVPEDLEENWIVVPCPVGKRCLVVACKGRTRAYARNGYSLQTFPSALPGGCKGYDGNLADYSLLDCVYSEPNTTFYVLDIMCWKSHPVFDTEAEFRFYWLEAKLSEAPSITEVTEYNRYKFVGLPRHSYTTESVRHMLNSPLPFADKLDGILFYHKQAHYQPGTVSPLVGWLKAYMVPEVLGIDVAMAYNDEKPSAYTSLRDKVANKEAVRVRRLEKPKTDTQEGDDEKMETQSRRTSKKKEKVVKMEEETEILTH